jgi:hypothetical protein
MASFLLRSFLPCFLASLLPCLLAFFLASFFYFLFLLPFLLSFSSFLASFFFFLPSHTTYISLYACVTNVQAGVVIGSAIGGGVLCAAGLLMFSGKAGSFLAARSAASAGQGLGTNLLNDDGSSSSSSSSDYHEPDVANPTSDAPPLLPEQEEPTIPVETL